VMGFYCDFRDQDEQTTADIVKPTPDDSGSFLNVPQFSVCPRTFTGS